ncbi:MAG: hypothetical protein ACXACR_02520, partial [Candidatus Hodarchaeales archaeon]
NVYITYKCSHNTITYKGDMLAFISVSTMQTFIKVVSVILLVRKMNKQDIEKLMKHLEKKWLDLTKSLPMKQYENSSFNLNFYLKTQETPEEVIFYGEANYQINEESIWFDEEDCLVMIGFSDISNIFVDYTGVEVEVSEEEKVKLDQITKDPLAPLKEALS